MRFSIFIIVLLSPVILLAQMTAPGSSSVRYTTYLSAPAVKDPVFIFCNLTGSVTGALNVLRPKGSGVYDYYWYGWNDATKSFNIDLKTESGVTASSITGLNEGGFKVDILKGGIYDTSLIGWVFIDKPFSSASLQNQTCDYVALRGKAAIDTFYYKDPADGKPLKLRNGVRFLWTSDPFSSIPAPDYNINPQTFNPPLFDVTYKLTVTDSLTCSSESSFFYPSIHVKADFTAGPTNGEAPLEVTFTDKSIRASNMYTWEFGEKKPNGEKVPDWIIQKDSLWVMSSPFLHTYYIPGEYSVKLTIESSLHCVDSFRLEPKIKIEPSELAIPNVFTPDGDGQNDVFVVESKSLRFLSVEIYSRSGMKVYSFLGEGEKLKNWGGWDGNLNNSSIKASPGVYFYIIRAYGWDNIKYDNKDYRGVLYLYR